MDLGVQLSDSSIFPIIFHKHAAGLFIEARFRERHDEETRDDFKNIREAELVHIPILLQGIDANFTVGRNVGVENFGQEVALWWLDWEVVVELENTPENAALIWRADRTIDIGLDVGNVIWVTDKAHPRGWRVNKFALLL